MKEREKNHNHSVKTDPRKVYVKIREMGGFNMELLYEYECETEQELRMEEQRCMDKMKPTLNMIRAFNTEEDTLLIKKQYYDKNRDVIKQHYEQNKNVILEKRKQHYEQNKDVIIVKAKQYYEQNKDVILVKAKQHYEQNKDVMKQDREENKDVLLVKARQYREQNKDEISLYQKQYQQKNREDIIEYKRQHYEKNKHVILEKQRQYREQNKQFLLEKINCECGCVVGRTQLNRHKKTPKHIRLMEQQQTS